MRDNALPLYIGLFALASWSMVSADSDRRAGCEPMDEATIARLFEEWNQALSTLDAEAVAAHYAGDGILLPPDSEDVHQGRGEIVDYFRQVLQQRPQASIESRSIRIGCNSAIDAGRYLLSLDQHGQPSARSARYTLNWAFHDGHWLIRSHHFSFDGSDNDVIAAN